MNSKQKEYVEDVRRNTAYPVYRTIINIVAVLGVVASVIAAISALISGLRVMQHSVGSGLVTLGGGMLTAVLIYFGSRFAKEAAIILADIGDSIIERNSRER